MIDGYLPEFCDAIGQPHDYNGPLYWPDDVYVEYAAKAMDAGFNVHVHAMGDGSVKQSAECLAKAQHITGKQPRNIIAHVMLTPDETAKLMGEEKIIANCQPTWMMLESDVTGEGAMFGMEKALQSYPFRKFLDNGVTVAFGTDFPVTPPPDTMQEICVAMTRMITPGSIAYDKFKGQKLGEEEPATLAEAVKSLSINGAFQMFGEDYTGSIEEGKSAELVVLDSDLEATPAEEIYTVKIDKTVFKGKVVFDRASE
jgi:predicted amidohydrolase YtcJ